MSQSMNDENMKRDEKGHFEKSYDDGDFLEAIAENGGMASSSEVGDSVGCETETARIRLIKLSEAGKVKEKRFSNALVWELDD